MNSCKSCSARRRPWIALALLLLAGTPRAEPARPDLAAVARQVVGRTNEFRASQGFARTETDATLAATARSLAEFMASTDRNGHEADGSSPAQRAEARGYAHCSIAENIAYLMSSESFSTEALARGLVEGWKNSTGHRRNMLDADVVETGVAIAQSAKSRRYYAVQMFVRPRSKAIRFSITNAGPGELHYELGGKPFGLAPAVTRTHTQCSAASLSIESGRDPQVVKPENGARYRYEREVGERYRLRQE